MPTFANFGELEKFLKDKIANALENEVAEIVRDHQQIAIEDVVYSRYNVVDGVHQDPYVYERRRDRGGLSDRHNMIGTIDYTTDGVRLSIENITKGADSNFEIAGLIEYGDGWQGKEYEYKRNRDNTAYQYLNPRPFIQTTRDRLRQSGDHVRSLRDGLIRQGIVVK